MSIDTTVGITVGEMKGLRADFEEKLASENGRDWMEAFKLFLKKQNPWEVSAEAVKVESSKPAPIERIRVINDLTIEVNLDAPLILPFNGAKVANEPKGKGWVKVERRGKDLFVDGKKIDLFLSKRQQGSKCVSGHDLRTEVEIKSPLHPNIMDALYDNQYLVPDKFKKDENGNIRYIFFWDVIFADARGGLYVRCFDWDAGVCDRDYNYLDNDWNSDSPAAVSAS